MWGFELFRREAFISANQARLLALERLSVTYLLCVKNDVRLSPGCAHALVAAAERQRADVGVPLVLEENDLGHQRIHLAGGTCRLRWGWDGMRLRVRQYQRHWDSGQQPSGPAPTELAEYHALLLRTSFACAHPLHDAAIESLPEVLDFSLAVQRYGGTLLVGTSGCGAVPHPNAGVG